MFGLGAKYTTGSLELNTAAGTALGMEFVSVIYRNSVRTSQETYCVSITKNSRLMLVKKLTAAFI
jgi:hypothetical protein